MEHPHAKVALLVLIGSLCYPAASMWMRADDVVPVDRLVENLKKVIEEDSDNAQAYYQLARVHSFAYALGRDAFEAFPPNRGYNTWCIADHGALPHPLSQRVGPIPSRRLNHLADAIRTYRVAVAKAPEDMLAWLGLGYVYAEAAKRVPEISWPSANDPFDEEATAKGRDKLFWEGKALEAYRKAFALDKDRRGSADGPPIAWEAGQSILSILKGRENLTRGERKEVERLEAEVAKMPNMATMVTPIIFSFDNRPLDSLVDKNLRVGFDLDGSGSKLKWAWVNRDTALLAWDPMNSGRIRSGRQLIGSATWWMFWKSGYAALAALDNNGNGWLTGEELRGLVVWQDRNADGASDPGEVVPVKAIGIEGINAGASGSIRSMPYCEQGIRLSDGRTLATYDWVSDGIAGE